MWIGRVRLFFAKCERWYMLFLGQTSPKCKRLLKSRRFIVFHIVFWRFYFNIACWEWDDALLRLSFWMLYPRSNSFRCGEDGMILCFCIFQLDPERVRLRWNAWRSKPLKFSGGAVEQPGRLSTCFPRVGWFLRKDSPVSMVSCQVWDIPNMTTREVDRKPFKINWALFKKCSNLICEEIDGSFRDA